MMFFHRFAEDLRNYLIFGKKGGSGARATLHAPTISLEGDILTITDDPRNGDFASSFDILCEGNVVKTVGYSETEVDLSEITGCPTGTDSFTVRAKGAGMNPSNVSNSVEYEVVNYFITLDDEQLVTSDDKIFISA